jgi:hypothetical protein
MHVIGVSTWTMKLSYGSLPKFDEFFADFTPERFQKK